MKDDDANSDGKDSKSEAKDEDVVMLDSPPASLSPSASSLPSSSASPMDLNYDSNSSSSSASDSSLFSSSSPSSSSKMDLSDTEVKVEVKTTINADQFQDIEFPMLLSSLIRTRDKMKQSNPKLTMNDLLTEWLQNFKLQKTLLSSVNLRSLSSSLFVFLFRQPTANAATAA